MKVILLTGHSHDTSNLHPALKSFYGQLWIDWQINQLRSLGHQVIVVLGDQACEEIISQSKSLARAALVFDTNGLESTEFTNLKAGLAQAQSLCSAISITTPCPETKVWSQLLHHNYKAGTRVSDLDLCQGYTIEKGKIQAVYPLLVTQKGAQKIVRLPDFKGPFDSRVNQSAFPVLFPLPKNLKNWGLSNWLNDHRPINPSP